MNEYLNTMQNRLERHGFVFMFSMSELKSNLAYAQSASTAPSFIIYYGRAVEFSS